MIERMPSTRSLDQALRWATRRHVRIYNLVFAALAVAAGVLVFELTDLTRDAKSLLAGALLAGGIGVVFAELTTTSDRRKVDELRREVLARCRTAYRLGEFFLPFHSAAAAGERTHRYVRVVLALGEIISLRSALEYIVDEAPAWDFEEAREELLALLPFAGDDLTPFFFLGIEISALRGASLATEDAQQQVTIVIAQVTAAFESDIEPYLDDEYVLRGWLRLDSWWNAQALSEEALHVITTLFHAYFLVLGARPRGAVGRSAHSYRNLIAKIAQMPLNATADEISGLVTSAQALL